MGGSSSDQSVDPNSIFRVDDEVEAPAGLLRLPSGASTDQCDDWCENFLYVFKRLRAKVMDNLGCTLSRRLGFPEVLRMERM